MKVLMLMLATALAAQPAWSQEANEKVTSIGPVFTVTYVGGGHGKGIIMGRVARILSGRFWAYRARVKALINAGDDERALKLAVAHYDGDAIALILRRRKSRLDQVQGAEQALSKMVHAWGHKRLTVDESLLLEYGVNRVAAVLPQNEEEALALGFLSKFEQIEALEKSASAGSKETQRTIKRLREEAIKIVAEQAKRSAAGTMKQ